jgi:hypothetical protein
MGHRYTPLQLLPSLGQRGTMPQQERRFAEGAA